MSIIRSSYDNSYARTAPDPIQQRAKSYSMAGRFAVKANIAVTGKYLRGRRDIKAWEHEPGRSLPERGRCAAGGGPVSAADHDGRAACHDDAAVCGAVTHACGRLVAYEDRGGAFDNRVRRACTGCHIAHTCRRLPADEHGRTTRRKDRPAHVRNRRYCRSLHRTCMHITYSCCRWHWLFPLPVFWIWLSILFSTIYFFPCRPVFYSHQSILSFEVESGSHQAEPS